MTKPISNVLLALAAAGFLSACAAGSGQTWYEERCSRMGMAKGTADFDQCISRDKQWVDDTHKRAARQNHP